MSHNATIAKLAILSLGLALAGCQSTGAMADLTRQPSGPAITLASYSQPEAGRGEVIFIAADGAYARAEPPQKIAAAGPLASR